VLPALYLWTRQGRLRLRRPGALRG
jgi:hypothetical protein